MNTRHVACLFALLIIGSVETAHADSKLDRILEKDVSANLQKIQKKTTEETGRNITINPESIRCVGLKSRNGKSKPVGVCTAVGSFYNDDTALGITVSEADEGSRIYRSYSVQPLSYEI
jgi:hypothetical protein